MNTVRIVTTQNIELEFDLANVGERLIAWLIDLVIFILYFVLIIVTVNFFLSSAFHNLERKPWTAIVFSLLILSPFIFYNLACEVWFNGQTLGKKIMKIKVISLTGGQTSLSQLLIRWIFRLVDIYLFNALPAFICVMVSDKKQRIGDLVAGTAVISTRSRVTLQHSIYVPTEQPAYAVSYPEIANLGDQDMQLIKDVLIQVNQTGNRMLAIHAADKIRQILQIQTNLEPVFFLQVLLADYNYLTSMPDRL